VAVFTIYGVRDLATKAKISPNTIARLERGETLQDETLTKVRKALEKAGVAFIDENGGGLGVRLKKRQKRKARQQHLQIIVVEVESPLHLRVGE